MWSFSSPGKFCHWRWSEQSFTSSCPTRRSWTSGPSCRQRRSEASPPGKTHRRIATLSDSGHVLIYSQLEGGRGGYTWTPPGGVLHQCPQPLPHIRCVILKNLALRFLYWQWCVVHLDESCSWPGGWMFVNVESALAHLPQVQFMVSWRRSGAPGGFALPHAEAADGTGTQRSPFRGCLETDAVFQRQLHLERRCSGPRPGPGLPSRRGKGQLRGPRRSADPATVHGRLLLRSWKKPCGKYALLYQNLLLTYQTLWNICLYMLL